MTPAEKLDEISQQLASDIIQIYIYIYINHAQKGGKYGHAQREKEKAPVPHIAGSQ